MIDIKRAEEEFKRYVSKYDMSQAPISRKFYHTFRVEKICGEIAKRYGMCEQEIDLAKLIGLLHDIARFEQHTIYGTYDDISSIDHGNLAIEILKKDNYIRKYIKIDKYDDIILKAIKYHNKYSIGTDVSEDEKVFCDIIRDADKLDIFHININESLKLKKDIVEKELITKETFEQFMAKELIDRKNVKNNIDRVVVLIAFIYDFNFNESYKMVKENNYIERSIDLFKFKEQDTKDKMKIIRETAKEYLEEKINEGEICLKNY